MRLMVEGIRFGLYSSSCQSAHPAPTLAVYNSGIAGPLASFWHCGPHPPPRSSGRPTLNFLAVQPRRRTPRDQTAFPTTAIAPTNAPIPPTDDAPPYENR